jgi:hypothetical protein
VAPVRVRASDSGKEAGDKNSREREIMEIEDLEKQLGGLTVADEAIAAAVAPKKLIVLDLNGLLVYRVYETKVEREVPEEVLAKKQHVQVGRHLMWKR